MNNVIKVKFINGEKVGNTEYTYYTDEAVKPGDEVAISFKRGIVSAVSVPEEEIAIFGDSAKTILGKLETVKRIISDFKNGGRGAEGEAKNETY